MIFYFSGTGNCKYVAERIATSQNDKAVSIETMMEKPSCKLGKNEVFGMVSPTYCWELPVNVKEFLENINVEKSGNNYMFCVTTYGTLSGANGAQAQHIFKKKGLRFDALYSVIMPDNWTPVFDLSNPEKVAKTNEKAEKQLEKVIGMIGQRNTGNHMNRNIPYVVRCVADISYQNMRKTSHFTVEDSCIGCGLCAKKCPANAIGMRDEKPVWVKDKCIMCLRCLHHCPKFSIQYGNKTKNMDSTKIHIRGCREE